MTNQEHLRVWNDHVAPKYLRFREILNRGLGAHGLAALARCPIETGDRVLDIGCGCGERTLDLAKRVGRPGLAVGVDGCRRFLEVARSDADLAQLPNVAFIEGDAEVCVLPTGLRLVFSQFGTMFFANPVQAMRNVASSLMKGGRLAMVVWRSVEHNPFVGVPKAIASRVLPPVPEGAPTCGPGPFSMADPDTVESILSAAGFTDVSLKVIDQPLFLGRTISDAVACQLALGPAGELMRHAGAEGEARQQALEAELSRALEPHLQTDGVWMPSSSWFVSARIA
jgi:ubiquinone/menaquinone biosynthesis C-methylase UbiE